MKTVQAWPQVFIQAFLYIKVGYPERECLRSKLYRRQDVESDLQDLHILESGSTDPSLWSLGVLGVLFSASGIEHFQRFYFIIFLNLEFVCPILVLQALMSSSKS